ncbi:MAG: SET domain-containing protein-lysine N-methyltransferase [Pseudomonadota bacterium]
MTTRLADLVYVDRSPIHGRGLFARVRFRKGQFIGTYSGPIAKRNGKYVLWITEADGTVYGVRGLNLLRYLNHAKPPNAFFDGVDLYAAKGIRPDDEITFDYGWED